MTYLFESGGAVRRNLVLVDDVAIFLLSQQLFGQEEFLAKEKVGVDERDSQDAKQQDSGDQRKVHLVTLDDFGLLTAL